MRTVMGNVSIDWAMRENARAHLPAHPSRGLRVLGFPWPMLRPQLILAMKL